MSRNGWVVLVSGGIAIVVIMTAVLGVYYPNLSSALLHLISVFVVGYVIGVNVEIHGPKF